MNPWKKIRRRRAAARAEKANQKRAAHVAELNARLDSDLRMAQAIMDIPGMSIEERLALASITLTGRTWD